MEIRKTHRHDLGEKSYKWDILKIPLFFVLFSREAPDLKDRLTSICKNVLMELSKPVKASSCDVQKN